MNSSRSVAEDDNHEEEDADAILAELEAEAESDTTTLHHQQVIDRLNQSTGDPSTSASGTARHTVTGIGSAYITLTSDDATLQFTTEHDKAVVHFYHSDFARCSIMNDHLTRIAQKHEEFSKDDADVKMARVDVNHAPFVVEKLGIRVLPCVIGFVKGVVKGRVVGFEGICWDGKEKSPAVLRALEEVFVEWSVLKKALGDRDDESEESDYEDSKTSRNGGRKIIRGREALVNDEDDDWD